jgi:hypothetical protein
MSGARSADAQPNLCTSCRANRSANDRTDAYSSSRSDGGADHRANATTDDAPEPAARGDGLARRNPERRGCRVHFG